MNNNPNIGIAIIDTINNIVVLTLKKRSINPAITYITRVAKKQEQKYANR